MISRKDLNILLLDTSSKKIEFSYIKDGLLLINERLPESENADMLIYHVKKTFNDKGIELKDIRYVSLSNGPGSFTGLRIGSAIAKGICYCTGSKLIEISSLDILANKYSGENNVISIIFSNTRTSEFYYCGYGRKDGKLIRLSDYKKDKPDDIFKDGYDIVADEYINNDHFREFEINVKDLSGISNSESQLDLTTEAIENGMFSNFNTSEPFYMNEFIPNN